MSQGKLRVINQGMQSENIQTPAMADTTNSKARRRSGQVLYTMNICYDSSWGDLVLEPLFLSSSLAENVDACPHN